MDFLHIFYTTIGDKINRQTRVSKPNFVFSLIPAYPNINEFQLSNSLGKFVDMKTTVEDLRVFCETKNPLVRFAFINQSAPFEVYFSKNVEKEDIARLVDQTGLILLKTFDKQTGRARFSQNLGDALPNQETVFRALWLPPKTEQLRIEAEVKDNYVQLTFFSVYIFHFFKTFILSDVVLHFRNTNENTDSFACENGVSRMHFFVRQKDHFDFLLHILSSLSKFTKIYNRQREVTFHWFGVPCLSEKYAGMSGVFWSNKEGEAWNESDQKFVSPSATFVFRNYEKEKTGKRKFENN